jgi:hypothetical protein
MTILAEDIEIPEVPVSLRTIAAHKKRIAALKRAHAKRRSNQIKVQSKKQK